MEIGPGEEVLSLDRILIKGLMHVSEKGDVEGVIHGKPRLGLEGRFHGYWGSSFFHRSTFCMYSSKSF
jgi:hypothetical protein